MVDARNQRGERLEIPRPRRRPLPQYGKRVRHGVIGRSYAPDGLVPLPVRLEVVVKAIGDSCPILLAYWHANEPGLLRKTDRHAALARNAGKDVRAGKMCARREPAALHQSAISANRSIRTASEHERPGIWHVCAHARTECMDRGCWGGFRQAGEQLAAGTHMEKLAERQHVHVKRRPAESARQPRLAPPYERIGQMLIHVKAWSRR